MDFEFNSVDELYNRVLPALNTRVQELSCLGVEVNSDDIWSYLISNKWKMSVNLTLFDIVDDILNTDYSKILDYVNNKL